MSYMIGQKQARRPQVTTRAATPTKPVVVETKPDPLPRREEQHRERPKSFIFGLEGKEITIQTRGGSIIEGTYRGRTSGFWVMEQARIIGKAKQCVTDCAWISETNIGHIHLPGIVTDIE